MELKGYKKLIVWRKADELAFEVYIATKNFPKDEIYGITSQLRRAVLSVPTNIVETEYLLDFSLKLGYLIKTKHNKLQSLRQETGALLWKFYKSL